jgi:hypothetical protein
MSPSRKPCSLNRDTLSLPVNFFLMNCHYSSSFASNVTTYMVTFLPASVVFRLLKLGPTLLDAKRTLFLLTNSSQTFLTLLLKSSHLTFLALLFHPLLATSYLSTVGNWTPILPTFHLISSYEDSYRKLLLTCFEDIMSHRIISQTPSTLSSHPLLRDFMMNSGFLAAMYLCSLKNMLALLAR